MFLSAERMQCAVPPHLHSLKLRSEIAIYDTSIGGDVDVIMLDTGITKNAAQFGFRATQFAEISKRTDGRSYYRVCSGTGDCAEDRDGHGTEFAGIIGSTEFGRAPKTNLKAIKVAESSKSVRVSD